MAEQIAYTMEIQGVVGIDPEQWRGKREALIEKLQNNFSHDFSAGFETYHPDMIEVTYLEFEEDA